MATISLCMIVRDEEEVLARCLDCAVKFADEIIIADTGSQDNTRKIALQYTDKVFSFPWTDDFAAARNFAFSKATMDYQMWLDADDILTEESIQELIRLKKTLTADVVMLPYQVAFDAQEQPTMTYYRERILKRSGNFKWVGAVHEAITPKGTVIYGEAAVQHRKLHVNDPDRNLRIFEKQLAAGKTLSPRELFYYGRELFWHDRKTEAAEVLSDFLAEPDGWKEDKISACLQLSRCYPEDSEARETALFRSFVYDRPRAEICCELGWLRLEEKRYPEAVFWYEAALSAPFPLDGFSRPDCHDYIPYIQLCVCYDRMGNFIKAKSYNDKAGRIKPKDAAFLANQQYFRKKLLS